MTQPTAGTDPASTPYPHLLEPITLGGASGTGGLTLRNRVVMGSMHTGLEDTVRDLPRLAAYFAERARGGVGLIVTGGYAPDKRGWLKPLASEMTTRLQAIRHREVTGAVHDEGGAIALQVLHAGRYGYHPFSVSASRRKSPITPFRPSALTSRGVDRTATHFARTAALAVKAGYDAVEVMGSEGYLINQFLASRTNDRTDAWGGSAEKRMRFPLEVVRRTRELVGGDLPVVYRISLLDLVEGGQTWEEVLELAQRLVGAGVTVLNTGIGWHEARVPTIITQVPPGAWRDATARLRADLHASGHVVPVCASNRINTPEMAEEVLATGQADLVSMARPLLADPAFVAKAAAGRADEINTCIACNQACLDHAFANRTASCLVNPRACRETTLVLAPTRSRARVAVVGAGPAGLATAVSAAERGLAVTLFEQRPEIGGQFRYAMAVPGKEDFAHTLRHYARRLEVLGVDVRLSTGATVADLRGFDEVVVATGVEPRVPDLEGVDHPSVVTYAQVLSGEVVPGARVAVVGAGGIGVDTSHFLAHDPAETLQDWKDHWGVGDPAVHPGGLTGPTPRTPARRVTLLQRKTSTIGRDLGKTSGWAHRAVLKQSGVEQVRGVTYTHVDDAGLHVVVDGVERVLEVDHIVLCAGQESVRGLYDALAALPGAGRPRLHLVGGADLAAELDAERAIEQGTRVAAALGEHLPDRAASTTPVGAPA
ncbi:2,4-dienoyl-CoA reductase [Nocardioides aquaticus]|uniref:2,4-dienoyl-CoA reductase n=1 Tax=Nocardioides aquaticus TaxID=160826 RepID=A0ABX8EN96_9ACTN|nr:NADPH-dependent 2,4-dienoyl-CoA reductase [Nocardioides aquaticus]QVT81951.1 2,4-dienoyl-CoA reductase [Nocardioides aquaticus]